MQRAAPLLLPDDVTLNGFDPLFQGFIGIRVQLF
jgi:hypothetical protein